MKNIKAIIFDAYGTLFDVNSAAEKCKDKIGIKWENFSNNWRTTQLEYTWLRSLMGRHKDFWKVTEDSLDKSMKVFNINPDMRTELLDLYKILSPYPEVKETLKLLREKNYIQTGGFGVVQNGEILKNLHTEYAEFKKGDDIFSLKNKNIVLKIDAEGHEKEVLEGLENNLDNNNILLQIEIFDKNFENINKILKVKNFNKINIIQSDGKKDYYFKNY